MDSLRSSLWATLLQLTTWALIAVGFTAPESLHAQNFTLSNTAITAPSEGAAFSLTPTYGYSRLALSSRATGFDSAYLQISSDRPWAVASVTWRNTELVIRTDPLYIGPSDTAVITVRSSNTKRTVTVTRQVYSEIGRPSVILPNRSGTLLFAAGGNYLQYLDAKSLQVRGTLTLGESVNSSTDFNRLVFSRDGSELLALDGDYGLSVLDTQTPRLTQALKLNYATSFGSTRSPSPTFDGNWYRIWNDRLQIVDRSDFSSTHDAFVLDPDLPEANRRYLISHLVSSDSKAVWLRVRRRDVLADQIVKLRVSETGELSEQGASPLIEIEPHNRNDGSLLRSDDDAVLAMGTALFDGTTDAPVLRRVHSERFLALSHDGLLGATATGIVATATGDVVFPFTRGERLPVFLPDKNSLIVSRLRQDQSSKYEFASVDLTAPFAASAAALWRLPKDNTIQLPDTGLHWNAFPGATSYRVYASTLAADLAPPSPPATALIATTTKPEFQTPTPFTLGATYHWRVDAVLPDQVVTGATTRFHVAPASLEGAPYATTTVFGAARRTDTLIVSTLATDTPWSLASDSDALTFTPSSGTGPATVLATIDARSLSVGEHSTTLSFTTANGITTLPVAISVDALAITSLKTAPGLGLVYALSQSEPTTDAPNLPLRAHLLAIDPLNQRIAKVIPVGKKVAKFTLHLEDQCVYVADSDARVIRPYALDSLIALPPLPIGFSNDYGPIPIADLVPVGVGRLYLQSENPFGNGRYARFLDTQTGVAATQYSISFGGLMLPRAFSSGFYILSEPLYYNRFASSSFYRFGETSLDFVARSPAFPESEPPPGDSDVYISGKAQSFIATAATDPVVFLGGRIYDANLNSLGFLDDYVFAASADGGSAFGRRLAYLSPDRTRPKILPTPSTLRIFHDPSGILVSASSAGLSFIDPETLPEAIPPTLKVASADDSNISFSFLPPAEDAVVYPADSIQVQVRQPGASTWTIPDPFKFQNGIYRMNKPRTALEFRFRFFSEGAYSLWSDSLVASTGPIRPQTIHSQDQPITLAQGDKLNAPVSFSGDDLTFTNANMPEGLSYDPDTQSLVGDAPPPGRYTINITATNSSGSASMTVWLYVLGIDSSRPSARYTGLLKLDGGPLTGTWTIQRTGTAITGIYRSGYFTRSFRAELAQESPYAPFLHIATGYTYILYSRVNILLSFNWDKTTDTMDLKVQTTNLIQNLSTNTEPETGLASHWSTETTPYPHAKRYTGVLIPGEGDGPLLPGGYGLLTVSLTPDGRTTVTGETALGQKFTDATYISDLHSLPIFFYNKKDTLVLGGLEILVEPPVGPRLAGELGWYQDTNSKAASYRDGFGQQLLVFGAPLPLSGKNLPPPSPLDNPAGTADFLLADGGLERLSKPITQTLVPTPTGFTAPKAGTPANPNRVAVKLDPNTGIVTGSAAVLNATGKKIVRTVKFRGMLVKNPLGDGEDIIGGYFLFPDAKGLLRSGRLEINEPEIAD